MNGLCYGLLPVRGYARPPVFPVQAVTIPIMTDRPGGMQGQLCQVGTATVPSEMAVPGMFIYFPEQRTGFNQNHAGYHQGNVPNISQNHGAQYHYHHHANFQQQGMGNLQQLHLQQQNRVNSHQQNNFMQQQSSVNLEHRSYVNLQQENSVNYQRTHASTAFNFHSNQYHPSNYSNNRMTDYRNSMAGGQAHSAYDRELPFAARHNYPGTPMTPNLSFQPTMIDPRREVESLRSWHEYLLGHRPRENAQVLSETSETDTASSHWVCPEVQEEPREEKPDKKASSVSVSVGTDDYAFEPVNADTDSTISTLSISTESSQGTSTTMSSSSDSSEDTEKDIVESDLTPGRKSPEPAKTNEVAKVSDENRMLTLELPEIERAINAEPSASLLKSPSGWKLDVGVSVSCDSLPSESDNTPVRIEKADFKVFWSDNPNDSGAGAAAAASNVPPSIFAGLEEITGACSSLSLSSRDFDAENPENGKTTVPTEDKESAIVEKYAEQSRLILEPKPLNDRYGCTICSESLECTATKRNGGIFITLYMSSINPNDIVATPCGHLFHNYCLHFWFYVDTVNKYTSGQGRGILNLLPLFSSTASWTCPICRVHIPGPTSLLKIFPSSITASESQEGESETPDLGNGSSDQCSECAVLNHVVLQRDVLQTEVDAGCEMVAALNENIGTLRTDLACCELLRNRLAYQVQDLSHMQRQLCYENIQLRNLIQTLLNN